MTRSERAVELFMQGFNCAQSVSAAFSADVGMSEEQLLNLTAALGAGFARSRNLCGAVNAMGLVIGMLRSKADKREGKNNNAEIYALGQKALEEFNKKYGEVNCVGLLKKVKDLSVGGAPGERTEQYYRERPCAMIVRDAVEITERVLEL